MEREQQIAQWSSTLWGQSPRVARTAPRFGALRNAYDEPAQLGVDRWLAMIAAWQHSKGAFAVADCGSALTVDLVAADGRHLGGYIGPGYQALLAALDAETAGVRAAPSVPEGTRPGCATGPAARSGALLMLAGIVERARNHLPEKGAPLYLTGGDAPMLLPCLEKGDSVVVKEGLVLDGLCHLVP